MLQKEKGESICSPAALTYEGRGTRRVLGQVGLQPRLRGRRVRLDSGLCGKKSLLTQSWSEGVKDL